MTSRRILWYIDPMKMKKGSKTTNGRAVARKAKWKIHPLDARALIDKAEAYKLRGGKPWHVSPAFKTYQCIGFQDPATTGGRPPEYPPAKLVWLNEYDRKPIEVTDFRRVRPPGAPVLAPGEQEGLEQWHPLTPCGNKSPDPATTGGRPPCKTEDELLQDLEATYGPNWKEPIAASLPPSRVDMAKLYPDGMPPYDPEELLHPGPVDPSVQRLTESFQRQGALILDDPAPIGEAPMFSKWAGTAAEGTPIGNKPSTSCPPPQKFTDQDFEVFKSALAQAMEVLHLNRWRVVPGFKSLSTKDNLVLAETSWDLAAMAAEVTLDASELHAALPDPRRVAVHEALEILMAELETYMQGTMVKSHRSQHLFHEIIRSLETPILRAMDASNGKRATLVKFGELPEGRTAWETPTPPGMTAMENLDAAVADGVRARPLTQAEEKAVRAAQKLMFANTNVASSRHPDALLMNYRDWEKLHKRVGFGFPHDPAQLRYRVVSTKGRGKNKTVRVERVDPRNPAYKDAPLAVSILEFGPGHKNVAVKP